MTRRRAGGHRGRMADEAPEAEALVDELSAQVLDGGGERAGVPRGLEAQGVHVAGACRDEPARALRAACREPRASATTTGRCDREGEPRFAEEAPPVAAVDPTDGDERGRAAADDHAQPGQRVSGAVECGA